MMISGYEYNKQTNISGFKFYYSNNQHNKSMTEFNFKEKYYDSIISNPPYFEEALHCPDKSRNDARHTSSLPFSELISCSKQLLTDDGTLTLILPTTALSRIESECAYANMFIVKKIYIRTTEKKAPKRIVLFIRKHSAPVESETQTLMVKCQRSKVKGQRTPWYEDLTKNFYLSRTPSDRQP